MIAGRQVRLAGGEDDADTAVRESETNPRSGAAVLQAHVNERDIGLLAVRKAKGGFAICSQPHDFTAVLLQQRTQVIDQKPVILDDQNAHAVPLLGPAIPWVSHSRFHLMENAKIGSVIKRN
jgi:hypothetical protein